MKEKLLMSVYTTSISSIHVLGLWCLTPPSKIFLLERLLADDMAGTS
jgi:hypothetical protein